MADFSNSKNYLQALRRKFEALLEEAARDKAPRVRSLPHRRTRLREAMAFGANPGNLRMLVHVPERLPSVAPLVVALHGCNQTADEYDYGTGWSSLANRLGFAVVYPEQRPANNPKNCFSWFLPGDTARGHGEALSIQQMVEHAITMFGVDRRRVFVNGLSAGGAMAAVILATYPEVFAGGAIIAGLPYGCARSVQQALEAMFTEQSQSAQKELSHFSPRSTNPNGALSRVNSCKAPLRGDKAKPSVSHIAGGFAVCGLDSAPTLPQYRPRWNLVHN